MFLGWKMWKGLANSLERKSESRAPLICDAAVANLQDETVKQQIQAVPQVPMFWLLTNYHRTNLCQHVWTVIQPRVLVVGSFSFNFWKHTESKNKAAKTETLYGKQRDLHKVRTHKPHLSLTQKGGVYDSLQCLQAKTGSYFLKRLLLPQSSSEQFLSGQGCFAAPGSESSLTRRRFL